VTINEKGRRVRAGGLCRMVQVDHGRDGPRLRRSSIDTCRFFQKYDEKWTPMTLHAGLWTTGGNENEKERASCDL